MFAAYIRIMLLLEAAAYVAIAERLHFLCGTPYDALAACAVGAVLAVRFAMVCATTALAFAVGGPRERRLATAAKIAVREWRAVLLSNLFYFPWERLALRRDPAPEPTGRAPIVLVHGYVSNRGYWRPLVRALEARGIGPVFAPNLRSIFATIEDMAAGLDAEIERVAAATTQPKVILVCHSMGGLAARAYLARHGARRVAKVITVASPHHGTVHARLGVGANARQMERGSRFLAALAAAEGERGPACPFTSIYTPDDNLVAPQDSSRLAWAKNVAMPGLAHVDILLSAPLAEAVAGELG